MSTNDERDLKTLRDQSRAAWDANAAFWDEKMGEGNQFQRLLVNPAAERLLELRPGELVLELACGNGLFARRLADLGARVVATDFSRELIQRAQAHATPHADRIEYRYLDATDGQQLQELGEKRFDAIVANMAIMDIASIEPLMNAAPRLLKSDGRFVFTILHPCFNSTGTLLVGEEEDHDGKLETTFFVKVKRYKSVGVTRGLAIIGQPAPQYYFHRTLTELFGAAFRAGLVVDGLEEPSFAETVERSRWLSWTSFQDIPPVLAARFRPFAPVQS